MPPSNRVKAGERLCPGPDKPVCAGLRRRRKDRAPCYGRRQPATYEFGACRSQSRGWSAFEAVIQFEIISRRRTVWHNIMADRLLLIECYVQ